MSDNAPEGDLRCEIAAFIADYRNAGSPPHQMQRAVLAAFPNANGSDYAVALGRANRQRS
jgi:hypothetical protein